MKLLSVSAQNFCSYESFHLDLDDKGLSLIYGSSGDGKSTIPDLVCWCLFGETSKGGSVDEVVSWFNKDTTTKGELELETNDGVCVKITRIRSKSSHKNDLYWEEKGSCLRGKDITDTQKLVNQRLGLSYSSFVTSCYFHEFSPVATFFNSKPKDRRSTFEKIADLDFPVALSEKVSEHKKKVKKENEKYSSYLTKETSELRQLKKSLLDSETRKRAWDQEQETVIKDLKDKFNRFLETKELKIRDLDLKIKELSSECEKSSEVDNTVKILEGVLLNEKSLCPVCGNDRKDQKRSETESDLKRHLLLQSRLENYSQTLKSIRNDRQKLQEEPNLYGEQLRKEGLRHNPFFPQVMKLMREQTLLEDNVQSLSEELNRTEEELRSLNVLYDISFDLRGKILENTVDSISTATNEKLVKYFDSAISVKLFLEGSDSLAVDMQKSGYACSYFQLSRGQRAMLRLCFAVSVMEAASNKSGSSFSVLWFDEVLDGLSENIKIKSFSLFEDLAKSHPSVFLIDHCEAFQNMFDNKYFVSVDSDRSVLNVE